MGIKAAAGRRCPGIRRCFEVVQGVIDGGTDHTAEEREQVMNTLFCTRIYKRIQIFPCPYCGERGTLNSIITQTGVSKNPPPTGYAILRHRTDIMGNTTYTWAKKGFVVRCNTKGCPGDDPTHVYTGKRLAIRDWNENAANRYEGTA